MFLNEKEHTKRQLENVINLAKGYGFFSIWMMVFEEEEEVRNCLIQAFPGTSEKCFDKNGKPIRRKGGTL